MSQAHRSPWPYCDSSGSAAVDGEKDACGVGFLAHIHGKASHWILQQALRALGCMEHRGGCGGDGDSGDGAGLLCAIPWSFLRAVWPTAAGISQSPGLGMLFMPRDESRREQAHSLCEQEAEALGLTSLGWRDVPIEPTVLGELACDSAPVIQQWLVQGSPSGEELEALLFRLRRRLSLIHI